MVQYKVFKLGFAPMSYNLASHLKHLGFSPQNAVPIGLLKKKGEDVFVPVFRNRVIFPIEDERGRVVGFGGRILDGGQPKYLEITNTNAEELAIGSYQIWRGTNGSDPAPAVSIPSNTTLAGGASWVIAYNSSAMLEAGFQEPDQTAGGINGNGNDVYQLRTDAGEYIDAFGLAGVTTAWYENSVAERLTSVSSGRASYNAEEWEITPMESGLPANGTPGTPGTHVFEPVSVAETQTPCDFILLTPYPNPFNPDVSIPYRLGRSTRVVLTVYDVQGRLVRKFKSGQQTAGAHTIQWNGRNRQGEPVGAGIYFVRLTDTDSGFGEYAQYQTAKLVLLK
jgi:hypothetical protein